MSLDRFKQCLEFTLSEEGGYSDDPDDAGGATNLGIEFTEWNAWKAQNGSSASTLEEFRYDLTEADVEPIYLEKYWEPINDGTLAQPVDACAFDCAVNEGVGKAWQFLTQTASIADPRVRAFQFQSLRSAHYRAIVANNPTQGKFLSDWLGRVERLTDKIRAGVL